MHHRRNLPFAFALLLGAGCPANPSDLPSHDAGGKLPTGDAGAPDAGVDGGNGEDGGQQDAGAHDGGMDVDGGGDAGALDAGSLDAGSLDAGTHDGGSPDGGGAPSFTLFFGTDFSGPHPTFGFPEAYPGYDGTTPRGLCAGDCYFSEAAPTGGFDGSQAAHLVMRAGADQFQQGWLFDGARPGGGWTYGDTVFIRFRIRFDDNYRWDGVGSQQNKMIDFGGGADSRVILHNERPRPTTPCSLNYVDYEQPGNPVFYTPADFGMPDGAFDTGEWGFFSLKNGIDFPCTPPIPVTYGRWYHVQLAVRLSSAAGASDGFFKLWIDNNDADHPSSQVLDIVRELAEWNTSWDVGGYWTNHNPHRDQGWVIDDFYVSDGFDPNWHRP